MEEDLINLLILLVCGLIAATIAGYKGRNRVGWFFVGFFFTLIGILIVAILPNLKEQREKEAYAERENRRLREQLRQERMKSEAFRRHATARLDTHDHQLGVDTRQSDALAGPERAPALEGGTPTPLGGFDDAPDDGAEWFYEREGEAVGPVSDQTIRAMLDVGSIDRETLVWAESLGDWTPVERVPELNGEV